MKHEIQPPKCGLFPAVDRKHLQAGITQQYETEMAAKIKAEMWDQIFLHIALFFYYLTFAYMVLFEW
jgi:hypothetical protein